MNMIQASEALQAYISQDIPAFLWGSPGVGKSDIVRQTAKALDCALIDFRAVLLDPVDLRGIPSIVDGETRWNPPQFLPNEKRDGARGILFMDELNAAPMSVQAALFQLVLDRRLGEYDLPKGWAIVAAGNKQSDRAAAQRMPSALANRFAHIDCISDAESFCTWAGLNGIAAEIVAFIRFRPELLHRMDGAELRAFPTPRAWVQVSKLLAKPTKILRYLCAGIIGDAAAAEFIGFLDIYKNLPSMADIFAAPDTCKTPVEISARWAVSAAVGRAANAANMAAAVTYLQRLSPEFATMGILDAVKRDTSLKETQAFVNWAIANSTDQL